MNREFDNGFDEEEERLRSRSRKRDLGAGAGADSDTMPRGRNAQVLAADPGRGRRYLPAGRQAGLHQMAAAQVRLPGPAPVPAPVRAMPEWETQSVPRAYQERTAECEAPMQVRGCRNAL